MKRENSIYEDSPKRTTEDRLLLINFAYPDCPLGLRLEVQSPG